MLVAIFIIVIVLKRWRNSIYVRTKRIDNSDLHDNIEMPECD